jgi:transcriptional regulator with XRE-family HTH domain
LLFLRIHFGKIIVHNNVHKEVPALPEDLFRIGEKIISSEKLHRIIEQILEQRSRGLPQQEVAARFGVDRTFVSRLESLGAVRKGSSLAVIGFPVKNKEEIIVLLAELGVDFSLIMTDAERWRFVREKTGLELLNEIMGLVSRVRSYDVVIVIGSKERIRWCAALLDKDVVGIEIGDAPITEDKIVDLERLRSLILAVR